MLVMITIDWDYLEVGCALEDDPVTPMGSEITVDYSLREFLQCKTVATGNYSTYMIDLHLDRMDPVANLHGKHFGHSPPLLSKSPRFL